LLRMMHKKNHSLLKINTPGTLEYPGF